MGILTSSFQSSVPHSSVAVLHAPGNEGKHGEVTFNASTKHVQTILMH